MDFNASHPLNNITKNNPYSMLEALIPFVDYPMKLPLALLVKYYEFRLILDAFQTTDKITGYGLHNPVNDPMEMLGNILGISPEMLRTVMSMMNEPKNSFESTDETYKAETNCSTNSLHNNIYSDNESTGSFDDNIRNIFAEYDLLQAAEYNIENDGGLHNEPE